MATERKYVLLLEVSIIIQNLSGVVVFLNFFQSLLSGLFIDFFICFIMSVNYYMGYRNIVFDSFKLTAGE